MVFLDANLSWPEKEFHGLKVTICLKQVVRPY